MNQFGLYEKLTLPPTQLCRLRNGVDRYGFSDVLAKRLGINNSPRSFGAWVHGWNWWLAETPAEIDHGLSPLDMNIITRDDHEKNILIRYGFKNVVAGGLPFAYVERSNQERKPDSLVVFLPHSHDYLGYFVVDEEYLNYIESIKSKFSEVYCCIYWDDYKNGKVVEECRKRNISVISGARADDVNALRRMRAIFDYFDLVLSTTMGSYILYAAYCGCRVSISEAYYYAYTEDIFKKNSYVMQFKGLSERYLAPYDKSKIMAQFPCFFVNHPKMAVQMIDWAKKEIGEDYMLDDDIIKEMLGWSGMARFKAISGGIRRRAKRYLSGCLKRCGLHY